MSLPESDNAQWILEVMTLLNSPDAELVRDVLGHMAKLRASRPVDETPPPLAHHDAPDPTCPLNTVADTALEKELATRRRALYSRLRDNWAKVRHLPLCLKQVQVLRETAALAAHSQILMDPLAEIEDTPLTPEKARYYAAEAVTRAEKIGDTPELIEACLVLAQQRHLAADFDEARQCCLRAISLAGQIHSLRHEDTGYRLLLSISELTDAQPASYLALQRTRADLLERLGDSCDLAYCLLDLARIDTLNHDLMPAAENLARAARTIEAIPTDVPSQEKIREHVAGCYHRRCALLRHAQGRLEDAAAEMRRAVMGSFGHERYRAFGMAVDVAFLESLHQDLADPAGFAAFCGKIDAQFHTHHRQWHLVPETPPQAPLDTDDLLSLPSLSPSWRWIDPLCRGAYTLADGLEITPAMGTGFLSNVSTPRLMLDVSGDFAFETTIDWCGDLTRAGGILLYHDDNTLIRYGAGIDFDGDITLTVKSSEQGFRIVGRGLLAASDIATLRLVRRGQHYHAWCSDGNTWSRCGHVSIDTPEEVQVGLFAECAYRDGISLTRCAETPVRFSSARLLPMHAPLDTHRAPQGRQPRKKRP